MQDVLHTTDDHQKLIYDELVKAFQSGKLTVTFQEEVYPANTVSLVSLGASGNKSASIIAFMEKHNLSSCAVIHFGHFASPASIADYDDGTEIE